LLWLGDPATRILLLPRLLLWLLGTAAALGAEPALPVLRPAGNRQDEQLIGCTSPRGLPSALAALASGLVASTALPTGSGDWQRYGPQEELFAVPRPAAPLLR
jgi:hypothetical protein